MGTSRFWWPRWMILFAAGVMLASGLVGRTWLVAADWPQWLGPNRDAVWSEEGIIRRFGKDQPRIRWRTPIGAGYTGPAVAAQRVFIMDRILPKGVSNPDDPFSTERVPGKERVVCLDARDGRILWTHAYECDYQISYPAGPRCTPTVDGERVYCLGAMGDLLCLNVKDGKVLWKKNLPQEYQARVPTWGYCGHPLVYRDKLICIAGGPGSVVVALDKLTGREIWKALEAKEPGYSPPTLIRVGDKERLVVWHAQAVVGLDPERGKPLWSVPLEPQYGMAIMAPRQAGNKLFAAGIGGAAVVLELREDDTVRVLWQEKVEGRDKRRGLYPVNMTPFVDGETIYGVDQGGMLRAVRLADGQRLWFTFEPVIGKEEDEDYKGAGSGTAFIVKNGSRYFLFAETGHLILAELTPQAYRELGRVKILEPTNSAFGRRVVWSHPAFADKCAFVRNDKEIVCVDLAE